MAKRAKRIHRLKCQTSLFQVPRQLRESSEQRNYCVGWRELKETTIRVFLKSSSSQFLSFSILYFVKSLVTLFCLRAWNIPRFSKRCIPCDSTSVKGVQQILLNLAKHLQLVEVSIYWAIPSKGISCLFANWGAPPARLGGAPQVRKCGNLPIRETLVTT